MEPENAFSQRQQVYLWLTGLVCGGALLTWQLVAVAQRSDYAGVLFGTFGATAKPSALFCLAIWIIALSLGCGQQAWLNFHRNQGKECRPIFSDTFFLILFVVSIAFPTVLHTVATGY
jgi:hypothetical protein